VLAIELDQSRQNLPPSEFEIFGRIRKACKTLSDIGKDIQAISHRLHSSKLEYLGIIAAGSSLCRELSEQQKVKIDFQHSSVPHELPHEISLCLFRVMQESLFNAVKHSGARQFQVELRGVPEEIQLTVRDSGLGFDAETAMNGHGLGLISMQERLHLVKGSFSIESRPAVGTTIRARVPLPTAALLPSQRARVVRAV
jgi:signal transduction histidine kinase